MPRAYALLVSATLLLGGCGPTCPSQATPCAAGGRVAIALPADPPLSAYSITASGPDGELGHCVLVAPDLPDAAPWVAADCIGMHVEPVVDSSCKSSCTPPPDIQCGSECTSGITGYLLVLPFAGQPKSVTFTARDSTEQYAPLEVDHQYETVYPDGESCGNSCQRAETKLALGDLLDAPP